MIILSNPTGLLIIYDHPARNLFLGLVVPFSFWFPLCESLFISIKLAR